ncbi:hypothetical protein ACS0TY_033563 [Phlomoides rotata]
MQVSSHVGSLTIRRRTYSKGWSLDQNTLSHMCLKNIQDFGHLKERAPTMFADNWVLNAVVESWHNNPHLKRGDELEIKFITVTSEDMTNTIQYPRFHFMKLQRPGKRASTYINAQETKPTLVVNLTEDEVSTRRALGVWVCLTEMDKIRQRYVEQKMTKILENWLIGTESTR